MNLLQQYTAAIERGELSNNELQRDILKQFQQLIDTLALPRNPWRRLRRQKPLRGIYLHGSVGVGKTYLMDLFFQHINLPRKARFHFHQFMQHVDLNLRSLQGKDNPVQRIASELAKSTRVLCLDEFLVFDVADAMILADLLEALFEHEVVLVVTSNTPPDDLYLHGVQRERFLPAIDLIKQHCEVVSLAQQRDYRLEHVLLSKRFFHPLTEEVHQQLIHQFRELTANHASNQDAILVQKRLIPCVNYSSRVIWFEFDVICNMPRCHLDYLEIAERFDVVFISNLRALNMAETSRAILLMHLIDVFYDKRIKLVISSEVPIDAIYAKGPMLQSFQRTISRLQEMQSMDYAACI